MKHKISRRSPSWTVSSVTCLCTAPTSRLAALRCDKLLHALQLLHKHGSGCNVTCFVQLVISEVSDSAALALNAVKLLAEYKTKTKSKVQQPL